MSNVRRIIDSMRGCTFTPEEANQIKDFATLNTGIPPLPLQPGERLSVRGVMWQAEAIIGDIAVLKKVAEDGRI